MNEFERLLEKKWADLRHLETERHWFLGFYSVLAGGGLALLGQINQGSNSVISPQLIFFVLFVLSVIGLLHTVAVQWGLGRIQTEINHIVEIWRKEDDGIYPKQIRRYWRFRRGRVDERAVRANASCAYYWGLTPLRPDRRWRCPPSLASLHVLLYVVAGFLFLMFLLVPLIFRSAVNAYMMLV